MTTVTVPSPHPIVCSDITHVAMPSTGTNLVTIASITAIADPRFAHIYLKEMPGKYPTLQRPTNTQRTMEFVRACYLAASDYGNNPIQYTGYARKFLLRVANTLGYGFIPAWIVKDKERRLDRSVYLLPEVDMYQLAFITSRGTATSNDSNGGTDNA